MQKIIVRFLPSFPFANFSAKNSFHYTKHTHLYFAPCQVLLFLLAPTMLMDFGAPIIPTNFSSDPESHLPFNSPLRLLLLPPARSAIQSLLRWHGREWSEVCMQAMQQWRMEKGKQISGGFGSGLSAPLCGPSPTHQAEELLEGEDDILSEERKAVEQLVQQSLHNTMKRMVKRANLPQDFVASHHFKSLSSSSTSKSLAF